MVLRGSILSTLSFLGLNQFTTSVTIALTYQLLVLLPERYLLSILFITERRTKKYLYSHVFSNMTAIPVLFADSMKSILTFSSLLSSVPIRFPESEDQDHSVQGYYKFISQCRCLRSGTSLADRTWIGENSSLPGYLKRQQDHSRASSIVPQSEMIQFSLQILKYLSKVAE